MLEHIVKSLDDVDEKYRDLYKETENGFEVEVKGVSEMKRAKSREKERAQAAEDELKTLREELDGIKAEKDRANDDKARKSGDIEALEASWEAKYKKLQDEKDAQLAEKEQALYGLTSKATAAQMAAEFALPLEGGTSTAPTLEKLILPRLKTEMRDGNPVTVVLDEAGKPSAMTIDEFKQEFASDPTVAPWIVGSKATGSGATGSGKGGGAAPKGNVGGSKEERAAYFEAKIAQSTS